jgi:DNA invertase Pin-like site-specific DNA recombinase
MSRLQGKTIDLLVRVSRMGERVESAESTITVDDQDGAMRQAIHAGGGRVGQSFKMLDQSGFTIHTSPVYEAILDRVRSGKSDGVAVAYADRLSRNWRAVGRFYDALEEAGGELLIAGMPGVDYRSADGRLILGMMHVAGETLSLTAKARGNRIADEVVERGVPNRVPYGYRRNAWAGEKEREDLHPKALVPDPSAAPVVARVFSLRSDGHSYEEICRTLTGEGIPAPGGGVWVQSSIRQTLRNRAYLGEVTLGGRVKRQAHEPLVSLALFNRVQSSRKVKRTGRMASGIAGSILVCSGCGNPMRVIGSSAAPSPEDKRGHAGGGRRLSYGCPGLRSGGECSRRVYVTKDVADDYVEDLLCDLLEQSEGVDIVASARELSIARQEAAEAKAEVEAFLSLQSALDPEDFTSGYRMRKDRAAEAEAREEALLSEAAEADGLPTSGSAYEALDFEARRRVARTVIDSIVVSPPLSRARGADITERFSVRFHGAGEVMSTA